MWLRDRAPLLPQDMSPAFWQSAPADQQLNADAVVGRVLTVSGVPPDLARFTMPAPIFSVDTRFRGRWQPLLPRPQSVSIDLTRMRVSMVWLAVLPISAVQNDVQVDRTVISIRDATGCRVPAGLAAKFSTSAMQDARWPIPSQPTA